MRNIFDTPTLAAIWTSLVIAVAASSVSYTITQSELFAEVRSWSQQLGQKIGYLFSCFYCMCHWIIIAGVVIYRPILINSGYLVIDLIVSTFFIVTITTFICGFIFKVFLVAMAKMLKEKEFKEIMSGK